jgi:hypothetical protein
MGHKAFKPKGLEILNFGFIMLDFDQPHGGWAAEVEEITGLTCSYFGKCS